MFDAIRDASHSQLGDGELAETLARRIPVDGEGALYWM